MRVLYIYRHPNMGFSIGKVFKPIEEEMRKYAEVDVIYMPVANYSLCGIWKNVKAVQNAIKVKQYDIVHITGTEHYLIPFLRDLRIVVTVHDLGRYLTLSGLRKWLYYGLHIWMLGYAKKIVCISVATMDELNRSIKLPKDRIVVIPDVVGTEFQYSEKPFDTDMPVILHIGTRPHKNLTRTIEAIKDMKCHLRIIGKVGAEDLTLLTNYKIEYSIVSNLSDDELLQEYKNADIINFPSFHEGFGMPIIEGQATGRVVVTSDMEPMRTVAGKEAVICDPYNVQSIKKAYMRCVCDGAYRESVISAGLENVNNYRLNVVAKQYYKLYKTL